METKDWIFVFLLTVCFITGIMLGADSKTIESRKPIKPILKITTDGVKSDTVYIYQKP